MSSTRRKTQRKISGDSEDEDYERRGEGSGDDAEMSSSRRAPAEQPYYSPENADLDEDAEGELDIDVVDDDTRFLPQVVRPRGRPTPKTTKAKTRGEASVPKRRSSGKTEANCDIFG